MTHKLAHYVSVSLPDCYTPDVCEAALIDVIKGEPADRTVLDVVGVYLPEPEPGWDLDRWWDEVIRQRRKSVGWELQSEYGLMCECCEEVLGTDLHEVFQPRSSDTSWRQIYLFAVWNCALVCRECHERRVYSDEFKEKIRARRRLFAEKGVGNATGVNG
jgi:hypothetical protein